jgi:PAS domain S-box-containing protein
MNKLAVQSIPETRSTVRNTIPVLNTAQTGAENFGNKADLSRHNNVPEASVLQNAILNSANFAILTTDEKGIIQLFNAGAEHMFGYTATEVMKKLTPTDFANQQQIIDRAKVLGTYYSTRITSGFEVLVFNAMRGNEDSFEMLCVRKNHSHFSALLSVIALHDEYDEIVGYLFHIVENTALKQAEAKLALLQPQQKLHSQQQPYKMLYVEDNPANLQLVVELIASKPEVSLLTAENGSNGIQIARSEKPDVILLDINLPDMSGFKVLDILRKDTGTKHIPVIALTANNLPMNVDSGLQAGFFRYLTKPFKLNELMDALDAASISASSQRKTTNNPLERIIP